MKFLVVCRKVHDYVRYDLKEIAYPSSSPDPPHIKKQRKLTWKELALVRPQAGSETLVPNAGQMSIRRSMRIEVDRLIPRRVRRSKKTEPSVLEDLAIAARGGMETLRPALQRIYMTRASTYTDALRAFVEGYQEGVKMSWRQRKRIKLKTMLQSKRCRCFFHHFAEQVLSIITA